MFKLNPPKNMSFDEICDVRQRMCLATLDKVLTSPPSKAKSIVTNYNQLEERWKRYDERHGFSHNAFLKMNNHFREKLNEIVDEMMLE